MQTLYAAPRAESADDSDSSIDNRVPWWRKSRQLYKIIFIRGSDGQ